MFKRFAACLVLALLLLSSACGEEALRGYTKADGYVYVTLGRYMQSIDGGVPEENKNTWRWSNQKIKDTSTVEIQTEPILWRVLTVDEEKAYLLSEYILFARPLHTNVTQYKTIGTDFGQTQLCAYLNGEFADTAFTEDELAMLLERETFGKVFLLNSTDIKNKDYGLGNGSGSYNGMRGWGTEYAIRVTGLFVYRTKTGSHSPYWVSDQSTADKRHGRCTKATGQLGHIVSDRDNEGVRPAVWLNMDSFEITAGTGTKTDPYVLAAKQLQGTNGLILIPQ